MTQCYHCHDSHFTEFLDSVDVMSIFTRARDAPRTIGMKMKDHIKMKILFQCRDTAQGPVSRKPRKSFGPVKPLENLEPYDYRAVLFTYYKEEGRFPSYKTFQAYTLLRF